MLSKLTTGSPLAGPYQASVWDNPALNVSAQTSAPDSGKFSSTASHGFLNDLRQKSKVSHPKVGAVGYSTTSGFPSSQYFFQIKSSSGPYVLSTGSTATLTNAAAVNWKTAAYSSDEFWYVDANQYLQSVYGYTSGQAAYLTATDTAGAVLSTSTAPTATTFATGGPAKITLATTTATSNTWNAAYHFVLANSQVINSATSASALTNALCSVSSAQYTVMAANGSTNDATLQDVTSATTSQAYCLVTPTAAGAATFAPKATATAGTLSIVAASSSTLAPATFPSVSLLDADTCYNPIVASSPFTATSASSISTNLLARYSLNGQPSGTPVLSSAQPVLWEDMFTWSSGGSTCAASLAASTSNLKCYSQATACSGTYTPMTLAGSSGSWTGVMLPSQTTATYGTTLSSNICITCTLDVTDYTSSSPDFAVYQLYNPGAFSVITLAANRESCYKSFLQSPGSAGTVTKATSPISSPYWYLYETTASRSATGKVISSDWMGLMTTGSTAWASGCNKSEWTCALLTPVTPGAAGSCGFTPNANATYKLSAAPSTNPYTPTPYAPDATTTSTSANAILSQDSTSKAWKLTVSNQQTVRVADSVCVVCRVDGLGVYSSSTYLNLQALAPAEVLYTTGLADVTPTLSVGGQTVTAALGALGIQARSTVTIGGTPYAFGPYFATGSATLAGGSTLAVTDGADASGTWGRYACSNTACTAPSTTTIQASSGAFDSFFWAFDKTPALTSTPAATSATAKAIYTSCTLQAATNLSTCNSQTAYTDGQTAGSTPYYLAMTTSSPSSAITALQVAAGYQTLACLTCTAVNPLSAAAFSLQADGLTTATPTYTITSGVAQYSQRSVCSSAVTGSVMKSLLTANAALTPSSTPATQLLANFAAARDTVQKATPTATTVSDSASSNDVVSPSETLYYSSSASAATFLTPQATATGAATGTGIWPTNGVTGGKWNSCLLTSCTLQSVAATESANAVTINTDYVFASTKTYTYTAGALGAGQGLTLAGPNVQLDRTKTPGWGGLFLYKCTYLDAIALSGGNPETESLYFQIGQQPNCPAYWTRTPSTNSKFTGAINDASTDAALWGNQIYQLPVSYSAATNGYGTGSSALADYRDIWTATPVTTNFPDIDSYWTQQTGTTPTTSKCGFKSCALYLPSASGSCLLPTTAGSEPTIPANQLFTAPTPLNPASTLASPVSYTNWESYVGDQAVPAWVNLSYAATSPWAITASNSNPLGYSHTVCYACSFVYNAYSPTVGKVTAKLTINAAKQCSVILTQNSVASSYALPYVKSTSAVWKQVSSSGWLDFFTNGANSLSTVAVDQNSAFGVDCAPVPVNSGTDNQNPVWKTCSLIQSTATTCSNSNTAYAGTNLVWGTSYTSSPTQNGEQSDIDQLWAQQQQTTKVGGTIFGWQESVCLSCVLADGTTATSQPITVSQASSCTNSLKVLPSLSPYQSVVYSQQRAQVLVTTAGWRDFFQNSEEGVCGITSCTMLQKDCVTPWPSPSNYSMDSAAPWAISAQVNVAAGYSDVMCIQCSSGADSSGFQTISVLYDWNLAPAQAPVLPTPAPVAPVIDPSIPVDDCATSVTVLPALTAALPLSYDGWFGTVQTVSSLGWADFFANSQPARCPITTCRLLASGCKDLLTGPPNQIQIDNQGNVKAHRDSVWGYSASVCVQCSNGGDFVNADGYTVAQTAMGFTDLLLQVFSFYNYVACGLVTSAYASPAELGPSPWSYCY